MRKVLSAGIALLGLWGAPALAEYSDDCRHLADKLAGEPGTLKVGELDLLKNCLSTLQRGIVLGEEPPPASANRECPPPPPVEEKECPVCPESNTCPKQSAAPAPKDREKEKPRDRDSGPDRRPKMYIY